MASLGKAEGICVDYAVRPAIAEGFEFVDDHLQRPPTGEAQHEWNVLEQDPRNAFSVEKAEDLANEAGPPTRDSLGQTRLAQVLARETSGEKFRVFGYRPQLANVRAERDAAKPIFENSRSAGVVFAQEDALVPSSFEAEFDASDSGEKPDRGQFSLRRRVRAFALVDPMKQGRACTRLDRPATAPPARFAFLIASHHWLLDSPPGPIGVSKQKLTRIEKNLEVALGLHPRQRFKPRDSEDAICATVADACDRFGHSN